MSRGKLSVCFVISLIIIGITFLTYGEGVESSLMGMVNAGTMPEKYLSSDGWVFDYAPVEHFLLLSVGFAVLYYGTGFFIKSRLPGKVLLCLYVIGFIFVTAEFWQLIGITLFSAVFIIGLAVYCLKQ